MIIYDYSAITNCVVCGSLNGNIDKFINKVIKHLPNLDGYAKEQHPKEAERLARLNAQTQRDGRTFRPRRRYGGLPSFTNDLLGQQINDTVLIVNGSNVFGIKSLDFYLKKLEKINDVLEKNNVHILFLRGTDDPTYFNDSLIDLSNIKTIKDYSVIKLAKYNCLCIGGGISVDRDWKIEQGKRLGKTLYWENEGIVYDEEAMKEIYDSIDIECVITPMSPTFVSPTAMALKMSSSWLENDEELLKGVEHERKTLARIYNKIMNKPKKPHLWVYSTFNFADQEMHGGMEFKSVNSFKFCFLDVILNNILISEISGSKKRRAKRISLGDIELKLSDILTSNINDACQVLSEEEASPIPNYYEIHYEPFYTHAFDFSTVGANTVSTAASTTITTTATDTIADDNTILQEPSF